MTDGSPDPESTTDEERSPLTWEPRPVPEVTPETAAFWEGAADGQLLLGRCSECDLTFFYPRARCPDCLAAADLTAAAGTGEVYSYTVPERITGWPEEHTPLVVAYVELDEGPRMVTNVVGCDPDEVAVGSRVEVKFVPTDDTDVAVPTFRLVDP